VCANPDDDTPRLVFADWLQENGEEARAEFIRIQVESERVTLSSAVGQQLFFRERELLCAHEVSWRAALPDSFFAHPFVRGFVEAATIGERRPVSVTELEVLFAASPLVDLSIYRLTDPGLLAGVPGMARIRTLSIGLLGPSDESVELFLTKTDLSGLKSLTVFDGGGLVWPRPVLTESLMTRFRRRFKELLVELGPD
jgi:uncharacterized protein (TIGR02996 family)